MKNLDKYESKTSLISLGDYVSTVLPAIVRSSISKEESTHEFTNNEDSSKIKQEPLSTSVTLPYVEPTEKKSEIFEVLEPFSKVVGEVVYFN